MLFPGGPLPLRIFETRYIDMISERLQKEAPFGVLLIRDGQETGPASTYDVGTLARITDWYQGSDGLLGVTAIGEQRFRLLTAERQADGLNVGNVELLPDEQPLPLPEEYKAMAEILEGVLDDLGRLYEALPRHYQDAGWVTMRFIEILPLELEQKQRCLEEGDATARLRLVVQLLDSVKGPTE